MDLKEQLEREYIVNLNLNYSKGVVDSLKKLDKAGLLSADDIRRSILSEQMKQSTKTKEKKTTAKPKSEAKKKKKEPEQDEIRRVKWVKGNAPSLIRCTFVSERHESVRREGVYEGIVSLPRREVGIDVKLITGTGELLNIPDKVKAVERRVGKKLCNLGSKYGEASKRGIITVYKITLGDGQNHIESSFGFAIVGRDRESDAITVYTIIDTVATENCCMTTSKVKQELKDKMIEALSESNNGCRVIMS